MMNGVGGGGGGVSAVAMAPSTSMPTANGTSSSPSELRQLIGISNAEPTKRSGDNRRVSVWVWRDSVGWLTQPESAYREMRTSVANWSMIGNIGASSVEGQGQGGQFVILISVLGYIERHCRCVYEIIYPKHLHLHLSCAANSGCQINHPILFIIIIGLGPLLRVIKWPPTWSTYFRLQGELYRHSALSAAGGVIHSHGTCKRRMPTKELWLRLNK